MTIGDVTRNIAISGLRSPLQRSFLPLVFPASQQPSYLVERGINISHKTQNTNINGRLQCPHKTISRQRNATIIGLPQDGEGGGVGQPRGIRLRKAHLGWAFDIHNDPRGTGLNNVCACAKIKSNFRANVMCGSFMFS